MSIQERVLVSPVMSGTDATDSAVVIWPYTEKGTIVRAYIANLTAVSADNSNNITVTATQKFPGHLYPSDQCCRRCPVCKRF